MADGIDGIGVERQDFSAEQRIAQFSAMASQMLKDLNNHKNGQTTTYATYDKDEILTMLRSPGTNSGRLIMASMKMYQNSPQYRRLIQYHANLPMWAYILEPSSYNQSKVKPEAVRRLYYKAAECVEKMNIKHEMAKAMSVALRDGVLYGVVRSVGDSWFVQRLDPSICSLTCIEDGTWLYSVNMISIRDQDLYLYPDVFREWKNAYAEGTGPQYVEVPAGMSFCLKADETVDYVVPPFASVLPSIIDLEMYRELAKVAKEISNYKMLAMRIPTNDNGEPAMSLELIQQFYQHLANALPPYVGAAALPMDLKDIDFESPARTQTTDLSEATRDFWYSTGTSPLLFGDASNTTSAALKLSIRTDEELVFALMSQCERLINRQLKTLSGSVKFHINLLPVTVFNQEQMIGYYKEAATYGLPTKLAYCASLGLQTLSVPGLCSVENEILGLPDMFVPLSSSHTQSGDNGGRPEKADDELGEAGEQTRETDQDANKG